MPKLKYALPSYRHHRASGNAFVVFNGRQVYLGKYGSPESHQKYNRAVAEWLASDRNLTTPPTSITPVKITVDEVIASFWKHAQTHYVKNGKPTSEIKTIKSAVRSLTNLYGDTDAAKFGPLALKAVREEMLHGDLCRKTINAYIARIKMLFKWGTEQELVPPGVYQAVATVRGLPPGRTAARESAPVRPVPEAHIKAVLPHVSRQVAAMIQVQALTAMRPGEVIVMRGGDIDRTGKVWLYSPRSHKTQHHDKARIIPIGPRAQKILIDFISTDPDAWIFDAAESEVLRNAERRKARRTPLWPSHVRAQEVKKAMRSRAHEHPHPYTEAAYRRAIERACGTAGVPHWHPNQLRHNQASVVRRMFGIETARALLGHSSCKTTEIYAEADMRKAIEAVTKLG